jgi:excinuclease UvrABC nuclease subunit
MKSLLVKDKNKLPEYSGIYYVRRGSWFSYETIYVGQAKDIRQRWRNHHKLPALRSDDRICYRRIPEWLLDTYEAMEIKKYNPKLNYRYEKPDLIPKLVLIFSRYLVLMFIFTIGVTGLSLGFKYGLIGNTQQNTYIRD